MRDEFQNQISSDRDLTVGFQNLAGKGKLRTVWTIVEKAKDRGMFLGSNYPNVA